MEDNTQDVLNAINPSTIEPEVQADVNTQETIQPEQPVVEETSTPPVPDAGETSQSDVDEFGVPWKNRAMEAQRKQDKTAEELSEIKTMLQDGQGQPKEKELTLGELQAFARDTDNPDYQRWAYDEIGKLQKNESAALIKQELAGWKKDQDTEKLKIDTFNTVINRNPDIAIRDKAGNFVDWNPKSPLLQRMDHYMNNPRINSQPDALEIAEAYAIRDLTVSNSPYINQKITDQKNKIANLQKQTLVEGGKNITPQNVSPRQAAINQAQSGQMNDATVAMKEILKATGTIKEQ